MIFSAIVAIDKNSLIGNETKMPWYLPADLKHFKQITSGHSIVMGRKTYQSLPKGALPNRRNIVMSRSDEYILQDAEVFHSLEELKQNVLSEDEVFIIGGSEIYRLFLPSVEKLYITQIHHSFKGSVFFPINDFSAWKLIDKQDFIADDKNKWDYSFSTWIK